MLSSLKLMVGMRTVAAIVFYFLSTSKKRNDKWLSLKANEMVATYRESKHGLHVW